MKAKVAVTDKEMKSYVQPGAFGEHMEINSVADGPVTLVIESVRDPKVVAKFLKQ